MTIRPGINEVVRVDGDIAQTRAALDLTGGHPASRMTGTTPSSKVTVKPARTAPDTSAPPMDGPRTGPSGPGVR